MREDWVRRGRLLCSEGYSTQQWREHGIRARRFKPCPHCGSVVAARERVWTPPYASEAKLVFRDARCVNPDCQWAYHRMGGTREAFVAEVNGRSEK